MRFKKLMLSVCAVISLNGCAYIIPPEQNTPRNNTVLGGPRRPQMNLVSGPLSALTRAPETNNFATAAPVVPVATAPQQAPQSTGTPAANVAAVPPAFEQTQPLFAQAQPEAMAPVAMAANAAPAVAPRSTLLGVPMPSVSRTYASIMGSDAATAPAIPSVEPAVKAQAERQLLASAPRTTPAENQQFQVAGNYPALDSVPPRPAFSGVDSSQSRLSATQAQLERARASALESKETLARDAAAEPSMLAPMPNAQPAAPALVAPAATTPALPAATLPTGNGAAVSPSPTAAPMVMASAAAITAPRIVLPTQPVSNQFSVPTGPSFAPPAPLNTASLNAPRSQPVRMAPAEQQVPAQAVAPSTAPTGAAVTSSTNGARQPIVLRAPVPYEATTPTVAPRTTRGGITVRPGDFDPLAGA